MIFGFDIISDLNLTTESKFDYEGKATSLFCIVVGNISSDMIVLHHTLKHLSKFYQGVFFIDGELENANFADRDSRIQEIHSICSGYKNIVYLHNNVVVLDGIAIIGINGWYNDVSLYTEEDKFQAKCLKYDDMVYLERTIEKLQIHPDVKKTMIVSSSVPYKELYYGEAPILIDDTPLNYCLNKDTQSKIVRWVFGSYGKIVDTLSYGINYLNNPLTGNLSSYYPKRVEIEL